MNKNLFTVIEVALIGGLILVVLYWGGVFDIKPAPTPTEFPMPTVGPVIPSSTPSPTLELEIELATPIPTIKPTALLPVLVEPTGLVAFNVLDGFNHEIYTVVVGDLLPSNELHNITNNSADDYLLSWSPDGSRIAFFSTRSGWLELYIMDADGSNVVQLTDYKTSLGGLQMAYTQPVSWSPDGTFLLAARVSPWEVRQELQLTFIDRIYTNGSGIENIYTSAEQVNNVLLSSTGQYVAMVTATELGYGVHVARLTGDTLEQPEFIPSCGRSYLWRPNSNELTCHFGGSTAIINIASSERYVAVAPHASQAFPVDLAWSPNGEALLVEAGSFQQGNEIQNISVSLQRMDGFYSVISMQNRLLVTHLPDWAWAPDNQWVAFTSGYLGQQNIFVANVYNPTDVRQLTTLSGSFAPQWQP
jgi:WD40 repeat protein